MGFQPFQLNIMARGLRSTGYVKALNAAQRGNLSGAFNHLADGADNILQAKVQIGVFDFVDKLFPSKKRLGKIRM